MKLSSFHIAVFGIILVVISSQAQPAKEANKYLGNITTRNAVRSGFMTYWNQITPENESKWSTVEGVKDRMSWNGVDSVANFAKKNQILWKFHTLVWGSQYPSWMDGLSQSDQLTQITQWFDAAAARYPDVPMIDVVNEAYPSHAPPTKWKNALGGDGATGYDWIIKSFQMARARWPKAILIYNDFNNIEWSAEVAWTPTMIKAINNAGATVDAIGCQAHDAYRIDTATLKNNINKLAATGLPIFITEFDIPDSTDATQLKNMTDRFTMFWNHPKVVGITYWGYLVGATWKNGTGLLNTNGTERPALTWLKDFVKNNPNPRNDFPNFLKLSTTATLPQNTPYVSPLNSQASKNGKGLVQLFNIQGRMVGSYYSNNQTAPVSSMLRSPGSYIVKVDGRCTGVINKVR